MENVPDALCDLVAGIVLFVVTGLVPIDTPFFKTVHVTDVNVNEKFVELGGAIVEPELVNDIYPDANTGDMIPSFIRYILHGERPLITAKEVLEAMAVSLSVEQSVLKHRPIKLKL